MTKMRLLAGSYGTNVPWPCTKVEKNTVSPWLTCTVDDAPGDGGLTHAPVVGLVWQINGATARLRAGCPTGVSVGVNATVQVAGETIRPILLPVSSVNHNAPSGPTVIPAGPLSAVGTVKSVMIPAVVIRPI